MGPEVPFLPDRRLPRVFSFVRLRALAAFGSPRNESDCNSQWRFRGRLRGAWLVRELHSCALPEFAPEQEFSHGQTVRATPVSAQSSVDTRKLAHVVVYER